LCTLVHAMKGAAILDQITRAAERYRADQGEVKRSHRGLVATLRRGRQAGLSLRAMGQAAGLSWSQVRNLTSDEVAQTREEGPE
jgi:hypothetical protein